MKFSRLVEFFRRLEETSSVKDMIDTLNLMFRETTMEDIDKICYFLMGGLAADYKNVKLGMGDKMVKHSIALASDVQLSEVEEEMKKIGDPGDVAFQLYNQRERRIEDIDYEGELSVEEVYKGLIEIAEASGKDSQNLKVKTLAAMLSGAKAEERRYLVRLAIGNMRLGVGVMTILDGLASAFLGSKDKRQPLEHAYNVSSDIGVVAKTLFENGLSGVKRIRIKLNRPIMPMLAQRVSKMSEIPEKIGSKVVAAEEKYDGERIQAHKDRDSVVLFSRRMSNVTQQFPEIVENVRRHVKAETAILDGEAVAYDFNEDRFSPFQTVMKRRRKYKVEEYAEKIPVKYMLFDVLYLNGSSQMGKSYPERRARLENIATNEKYIALANRVTGSDLEKIDEYFQDCIERGLEGIVCKSCADDSYYRAGAREWAWIKWKPGYSSELSDTLDLVVVGAYAGRGKRAGTYGSLLCAIYNQEKDVYQTVCKLGTGFTDEQLRNLPRKLNNALKEQRPARVSVTKEMEPDYWFVPEYVLEARASEITQSPVHTCNWNEKEGRGLALRFPRFERWRPEKSPEEVTNVREILQMQLKS